MSVKIMQVYVCVTDVITVVIYSVRQYPLKLFAIF